MLIHYSSAYRWPVPVMIAVSLLVPSLSGGAIHLLAPMDCARAEDLPQVAVNPGEIQVQGAIRSTDPDHNNFLMEVTTVVAPSGKVTILPVARPKSITLDATTFLHLRGSQQKAKLADLEQGVQAIATGKDLGVGRVLPARDIQVWSRMEDGVYILNGMPGKLQPQPLLTQPDDPKLPRPNPGAPRSNPGNPQPNPPPIRPLDTPIRTLAGHSGNVWSVAYSPNGHLLASGASLGQPADANGSGVGIWDAQTGNLLRTLKGAHAVFAVAFSPDGKMLATANSDGTIGLWDVQTSELVRSFGQAGNAVLTIAYSPDATLLASSTGDKTVQLWDVKAGTLARTLAGEVRIAGAVLFSPDGKMLVTGNGDRTIGVWDVQTGQLKSTLPLGPAPAPKLAFSPDGAQLATGGRDGTTTVWEVQTGKMVHQFKTPGSGRITAVAFSPDGKKLAAASQDRAVRIWDVQHEAIIKTIQAHAQSVNSVAFSHDGALLASASSDKTIKIWKVNG